MQDVDWSRVDKQSFFLNGVGLFSGVTTVLFPLSVIKTRQMSSHGISGGFEGTKQTARIIWRTEGIPGFYRGFATVVFGTIPARMVYLGSLEVAKDTVAKACRQLELSETSVAGISNFAGGASASLSTQLVSVPIDVVSQRQMVHGTDTHSKSRAPPSAASTPQQPAQPSPPAASSSSQPGPGTSAGSTRQFSSQASGVAVRATSHAAAGPSTSTSSSHQASQRRHLSALRPAASNPTSMATQPQSHPHSPPPQHTSLLSRGHKPAGFSSGAAAPQAPARLSGSAVARMIVREEGVMGLYRGFGMSVATFVPSSAVWWSAYGVYQKVLGGLLPAPASTGDVVALQIGASMLAGATSSLLTNPLDLVKTRIQVARKAEGQPATVRAVVAEVLREEGPAGLLRGALPRMANAALWGTCMVTVYEHLKRISLKPE